MRETLNHYPENDCCRVWHAWAANIECVRRRKKMLGDIADGIRGDEGRAETSEFNGGPRVVSLAAGQRVWSP